MSQDKNDSIGDVDFYAAIQAHVLWRGRLEAYINGTGSEKLDADLVSRDSHCALGEWIEGAGGKHFSNHPKFPELIKAHTCFHKRAGEVIRTNDNGDKNKAKELLKGEYAKCSQKVKNNLAKLGIDEKDA